MPPKIALIGCIVFVTWLLMIERKRNLTASHALWLPTIWFIIMASRNVGAWFLNTPHASVAEGSIYDRIVLSILMLISFGVLCRRKIEWDLILKDNFWLILLYSYLLFSVLWSDYPYVSFKRWFKIAGTIFAALVLLTERQPHQALESVFRRTAYVLIPLSIVLIKYFPEYGISYGGHEGIRTGTGVTTHKNSLGALCVFSSFFLLWRLFCRWRSNELFINKFQDIGDFLVICIALHLLFGGEGTYSATSILIFFFGITVILLFYWKKSLSDFITTHLKVVLIAFVLFFILFYNCLLPVMTSLLSRDESLL